MNSKQHPSWHPHGLALKVYIEGNAKAAINIHMDDGSITKMPIGIYFRTLAEFPEIETIAVDLCKGKVLDVGAGAGAHCLALQDKGFEVAGLDISEEGCNIMSARGVKKVHHNNFLNYNCEHNYDTLLFLMNGIGVAGNLIGLENYLHHAHLITSDDGQIILDSSDLRNGETELDFSNEYFGIIDYQLSFDGIKGEPYQWLYIDQELLIEISAKCRWSAEIIYEQEDGSYLAKLLKM